MNIYQNRVDSFTNNSVKWPHNGVKGFHKIETFARAGFSFMRRPKYPDSVRCFLCDVELSQWKQGQSPFIRHAKESSECAWAVLNFPEVPSKTLTIDPKNPDTLPRNQVMQAARLATFNNHNYWPPNKGSFSNARKYHSALKLVDAGFYFSPTPEKPARVKCSYCKLEIVEPVKNMDLMVEHEELNSKCAFFTKTHNFKGKNHRDTADSTKSNDSFATAVSHLDEGHYSEILVEVETPKSKRKKGNEEEELLKSPERKKTNKVETPAPPTDDSFWDIGKAFMESPTVPGQAYTYSKSPVYRNRPRLLTSTKRATTVDIFGNLDLKKPLIIKPIDSLESEESPTLAATHIPQKRPKATPASTAEKIPYARRKISTKTKLSTELNTKPSTRLTSTIRSSNKAKTRAETPVSQPLSITDNERAPSSKTESNLNLQGSSSVSALSQPVARQSNDLKNNSVNEITQPSSAPTGTLSKKDKGKGRAVEPNFTLPISIKTRRPISLSKSKPIPNSIRKENPKPSSTATYSQSSSSSSSINTTSSSATPYLSLAKDTTVSPPARNKTPPHSPSLLSKRMSLLQSTPASSTHQTINAFDIFGDLTLSPISDSSSAHGVVSNSLVSQNTPIISHGRTHQAITIGRDGIQQRVSDLATSRDRSKFGLSTLEERHVDMPPPMSLAKDQNVEDMKLVFHTESEEQELEKSERSRRSLTPETGVGKSKIKLEVAKEKNETGQKLLTPETRTEVTRMTAEDKVVEKVEKSRSMTQEIEANKQTQAEVPVIAQTISSDSSVVEFIKNPSHKKVKNSSSVLKTSSSLPVSDEQSSSIVTNNNNLEKSAPKIEANKEESTKKDAHKRNIDKETDGAEQESESNTLALLMTTSKILPEHKNMKVEDFVQLMVNENVERVKQHGMEKIKQIEEMAGQIREQLISVLNQQEDQP